jgi:hypothetical protein
MRVMIDKRTTGEETREADGVWLCSLERVSGTGEPKYTFAWQYHRFRAQWHLYDLRVYVFCIISIISVRAPTNSSSQYPASICLVRGMNVFIDVRVFPSSGSRLHCFGFETFIMVISNKSPCVFTSVEQFSPIEKSWACTCAWLIKYYLNKINK